MKEMINQDLLQRKNKLTSKRFPWIYTQWLNIHKSNTILLLQHLCSCSSFKGWKWCVGLLFPSSEWQPILCMCTVSHNSVRSFGVLVSIFGEDEIHLFVVSKTLLGSLYSSCCFFILCVDWITSLCISIRINQAAGHDGSSSWKKL